MTANLTLASLPEPICFVFSGGVSLGAVQVGMLRAVMDTGIQPQLMIGSSAGSLNAAFMAVEYGDNRLQRLTDLWIRLDRQQVFGRLGIRRFFKMAFDHSSLTTHTALASLIAAHVPPSYEELSIDLAVIATDYRHGNVTVFSTGELHHHLLASSSIPLVFPPFPIDGGLYVDGSVSAHVPLLPAQNLGARTLVVFDAGFACDVKKPPKALLDSALHAFTLMLHHQASGYLAGLDPGLTVLYLPAPCPIDVPAYDFSRAAELIAAGHETAAGFLKTLQLNGPGMYGQIHSHGQM